MKKPVSQTETGKRSRLSRVVVLAFFFACFLIPTAFAESAGKLAAQLARLRGNVENLTTDLDSKKEDMRVRLRSLAAQKAELEMEIQREELRLRQLHETQNERKERVIQNQSRNQELAPVLKQAIQTIRKTFQLSLPFKVDERLADLDKLQRQLENQTLSTPAVLTRLWSRIEDEFRLSKENGLYKQVMVVDDNEVLADVAKIGMVMLFFRTPKGKYGRAVHKEHSWGYETYTKDKDKKNVAALFEALEKNIRVGFFELPPAFIHGEHR